MTDEEKIILKKLVDLMDWHGPPAKADKDERKEWHEAIRNAEEVLAKH